MNTMTITNKHTKNTYHESATASNAAITSIMASDLLLFTIWQRNIDFFSHCLSHTHFNDNENGYSNTNQLPYGSSKQSIIMPESISSKFIANNLFYSFSYLQTNYIFISHGKSSNRECE